MTAEIARFLGYLISEGRTTKENQVWFVNEDKKIVEDFISCAKAGFDVEAKVFNYKKCAYDVLIFSGALCKFLEKAFDFKISGLSKDKTVPPQIFSGEEKIITEFLSALFEGDAYVRLDKQKNWKRQAVYFEYVTASEQLALDVSSLLLRLGVQSVIRKRVKAATNAKKKIKRPYYSVYVYGLHNVKRLADLLNFVGKKSEKINHIRGLENKANPNLDLIPEINAALKALVKFSGIKLKRFRKISPKLAAYYENRCLPSRQGLLEVLSIIAEHGDLTGLARSIYEYLKLLAVSDIYWDEISCIKKVYSEKWVYDLSVRETHNFVAQDIIVHNSNIFDSIRWVLGEQSAKSLRGSEMQDVIFNGSDSKEPLSLAEVTLTFDNQARFFNLDHPEVAITRRLFRSGESEYLLNKTQVRLKDILDLLLGTGIGSESYSIVAQGKIDLVLSSRPEDRRLVFDEAAGITKYKSQKKETQRKLEETEQNLLRINDIVQEVKRQISSLERQASKARRYKEVFEELKEKELSLAVFQKRELLKHKEEMTASLQKLECEESACLAALKAEEAATASRQSELKNLEGELLEIKNKKLGLENEIARANQHIDFNRERLVELEASGKFYENQAAQLNSRIMQDQEKLNNAKTGYSSISQEIAQREALLEQNDSRINDLAGQIKASLEAIVGAKREIVGLAAKISNVKNEISGFHSQQQVYLSRLRRLEIEKAKAHEEKMIIEKDLRDINVEVNNLNGLLEALKLKDAVIKNSLQTERQALAGIDAEILALDKQRLTLESHKEFLEKLKSKYEDIGESMNALILLDKLPGEKISGLVVKVKDYPGLANEDRNLYSGAAFKLSGEAKPIELDTRKLESRLEKIRADALSLKEKREVKEASLRGLDASLLATQQEARHQEIALANKETLRQAIEERFQKTQEEEDIIGIELAQMQKEAAAIEGNIQAGQSALDGLNGLCRQAEDLIRREEDNVSLNSQSREKVLVLITQTKTELEALAKKAASEEDTLRVLQETLRQDEENLADVKKHTADNISKGGCLKAEITACRDKILEVTRSIEAESARSIELESDYRRLSEGAGNVLRKIEQFRAQLDDTKNKLHQLQMQDKEIDYNYSGLKERVLQAYKIELGSFDTFGGVQTPPFRVGKENAALSINPERSGNDSEQTPAFRLESRRIDCPQQEGQDTRELSGQISRLKEKLDSYGAVNLVAIEEYDQLKARYDFLIEQQNDLCTAKESLHQAVLKINRITKQMFLETFEKVRVEFRNYFRMLFNGGDAQVFLIDEQDPLESGIEIICRPPGKKLQNVLLLSGGEKSLSAIALIFAIFKVKPAPFCILDEIDAALDEANVDRFSNLLQEFTSTSQFIVITHNKRTIANANVMYGITMEESGISKIVSVKFSQGQTPAKAQEEKTEVSAVS